jgi:hypothetical protein
LPGTQDFQSQPVPGNQDLGEKSVKRVDFVKILFSDMRGEREEVAMGWLSCLVSYSLQETGIPGRVSPLFGSDNAFMLSVTGAWVSFSSRTFS